MARTFPQNLPAQYEIDKMPVLRQWWDNDVGAWMRAFWPQRFELPVASCFGFTSNGSPTENTALSANHAAFSEFSHFGISGGWWELRVPNRDTRVENHYFDYHADARVFGMLGRAACMIPDCWLPQNGGLPDVTAVGIVTLEEHLRGVVRALPDVLRPKIASPWQSDLYCWGWSAGSSRAAYQMACAYRVNRIDGAWHVIDPFGRPTARVGSQAEGVAMAAELSRPLAAECADAPEGERMALLGRRYARWAYDGVRGAEPYEYVNPYHAWTRTRQKERAAGGVDELVRGAGAYWSQGYESPEEMAWIETVNAAGAAGIDPKTVVGPPPRSSSSSRALGIGVGLTVALGLLGVWNYSTRRR